MPSTGGEDRSHLQVVRGSIWFVVALSILSLGGLAYWSVATQLAVADLGSVDGANDPSDPFPEVTNLLTVADDFGSWSELSDKFFDEDTGIVTAIIAESGKGE